MKFVLNLYEARVSRLELTALQWLCTQCKFKGEVVVTRRSSKLFDFDVKWTESAFKPLKGQQLELWFPQLCRDQWLGTKWASYFTVPNSDYHFVSKVNQKHVWKDFYAVVAAAFKGKELA